MGPFKAYKAVKAIYEDGMARKAAQEKMTPDPEIPVPGRARSDAKLTNQKKANFAADLLRVPGRDTVRGAIAKKKKTLDEL